MTEKRNCDYYEKLDNDTLDKVTKEIYDIITANLLDTKILKHNLKNISFVLKSRKILFYGSWVMCCCLY